MLSFNTISLGSSATFFLAGYLFSFPVIFDLYPTCYAWDNFEQEFIGPKPRLIFCKPVYEIDSNGDPVAGTAHYNQSQWCFIVYAPLITIWNELYLPVTIGNETYSGESI